MVSMGSVDSGGSVPKRFGTVLARNPSGHPLRPTLSASLSRPMSISISHSSEKRLKRSPSAISIKREPRLSSALATSYCALKAQGVP